MNANVKVFPPVPGNDFGAQRAAENWLRKRGFCSRAHLSVWFNARRIHGQLEPQADGNSLAANSCAKRSAISAKEFALSDEIRSVLCAAKFRIAYISRRFLTSSLVRICLSASSLIITCTGVLCGCKFGNVRWCISPSTTSRSFHPSMTTPVGLARNANESGTEAKAAWIGAPAVSVVGAHAATGASASAAGAVLTACSTKLSFSENLASTPPGKVNESSDEKRLARDVRKRKTITTAEMGHASEDTKLDTNSIQFISLPS